MELRYLNIFSATLLVAIMAAAPNSFAQTPQTDVEASCLNAGLPVIYLEYREREKNIQTIRKKDLGRSPWAVFLRKHYSRKIHSADENEQAVLSSAANKALQPASVLKDMALRFATREQKLADPDAYAKALIAFTRKSIPSIQGRLEAFLTLKRPDLMGSFIQAQAPEVQDFYGARASVFRDRTSGKIVRLISVSNNPSENLPYLGTLLVHELVHAEDRFARPDLLDASQRERYEFSIVNEAKAHDAQLIAYLEAVRTDPKLFCNWLYPSWSYGEIVIPLSWTMAAMEREARSGRMISDYAKTPEYVEETYLLDSTQSLRRDLLERITQLKLKYVK